MPTPISQLPAAQNVSTTEGKLIAPGNDSAKGLRFSNDLNTGFYSNGTDVYSLCGNTVVARFHPAGAASSFDLGSNAVGFGANAPGGVMDVGLARTAAGQLVVTSNGTPTGTIYLQFGLNSGVNALVKCVNPTATTGASVVGRTLTVESGDAVASTDTAGAAAGGDLVVNAGDAARFTSGNANGGSIVATPGLKIGSGTDGSFVIRQPGGTPGTNETSFTQGASTLTISSAAGGSNAGLEFVMNTLRTFVVSAGFVRVGTYAAFLSDTGQSVVNGALIGREATGVLSTKDFSGGGFSTWIQDTAGNSRRVATQTVTDSTAFAADNTLTSTLIAGRNYRFRVRYFFTTVNSSGVKIDLNGGTGTVSAINGFVKVWSAAGAILAAGQISALNTSVGVTASGTFAYVEIDGSMTCTV